jgi:hypothetical protein
MISNTISFLVLTSVILHTTAQAETHGKTIRADRLSLANIYSDATATPSSICHILHFYGLGATDLPGISTGREALGFLLDENIAKEKFGQSPLIVTRYGIRYNVSGDLVPNHKHGEAHKDQCLATFATLQLPLETPVSVNSRQFSIRDLLADSFATFSIDQSELTWTAIAFSGYLPPQTRWIDRFGKTTTFSQLAIRLLSLNPNTQSCAGTHLLHSLAVVHRTNARTKILDSRTQELVGERLSDLFNQISKSQMPDGGWNRRWNRDITHTSAESSPLVRVAVTSHLLEAAILFDSPGRYLTTESRNNALKCLEVELSALPQTIDPRWLCPYTHSIYALRHFRGSTAVEKQ